MQVKCCRRQVSSESCHIFVSNIGPERESCDSGVSVAYSNHGCNTDHSLRVNFPIVSAAAVQCDRQQSGAGASDSGPVEKITSSLSLQCHTSLGPSLTPGHRQPQDGGRRQALPQAPGHGGEASSQSLPQEHVRPHRGGQESHTKTQPVSYKVL